jgi:uncharacterized protein YecT (DUF1311 family)
MFIAVKVLGLGIIISLSAGPTLAASYWRPDAPNVCNQQPITIAIVDCIDARTKVWDARLNQAYKAVNGMLQAQTATQQLADLKKAQRLWLQYRNANCGFYGDEQGAIREIDGAECLRRMTQDRAIELQLAGPEG